MSLNESVTLKLQVEQTENVLSELNVYFK